MLRSCPGASKKWAAGLPTSVWATFAEAPWPDVTALMDAARARRTKGVIRLDPR
jgi:hypothetical protein